MDCKFNSFEEISKAYPIGLLVALEGRKLYYPFYTENDLDQYKRDFINEEYTVDLVNHQVIVTTPIKHFVEGYLYDGTYWYIAHRVWSGWGLRWQPYSEEDINVKPKTNN